MEVHREDGRRVFLEEEEDGAGGWVGGGVARLERAAGVDGAGVGGLVAAFFKFGVEA